MTPSIGRSTTRRSFLAGCAALTAAPRLRAVRRDAQSLILMWLDGGMSHIDTFDAKPEAAVEIRGDLRSIRGATDGTFLAEGLPGIAARLDRATLIRSITHGEGNHDRGSNLLLTGAHPSPVLRAPSLGSIVAARTASARHALPVYIAVPDAPAEGGAGFLPATCTPFAVGGDPARPDFRVRDLTPRDVDGARAFLDLLDAADGTPRSDGERARDGYVRAAARLSAEPELREAFALAKEPAERRDRYGHHRLGQSCLLAARLVRHGARVVLVRDVGWDHHQHIARELTTGFPPRLRALDEGISALLDDLRDGPLAGRTMLCVASEFGRTPRINPAGGRDHWPRAQSVLIAGAGIAEGVVVGRTDARGEEPVERALAPEDLFATLVDRLGIDSSPLHTSAGRPHRVVAPDAEVIREICT
ncbi:MAG: DUF1501 domain-containing protein [Planctomycetota bacterium]